MIPRTLGEALLTPRQAAELLGRAPKTILRDAQSGAIPHYVVHSGSRKRTIRFSRHELEAWLEQRRGPTNCGVA